MTTGTPNPPSLETLALAFTRMYVRVGDSGSHVCVVCGALIDGVMRTEHYYWHQRHGDINAGGEKL